MRSVRSRVAISIPRSPSASGREDDSRPPSSFRTFWLVLGGCGSAVLAAAFPDVGIGLMGVSLAFGLTVVTGAYALGPVSGGHFNPAVSLGL